MPLNKAVSFLSVMAEDNLWLDQAKDASRVAFRIPWEPTNWEVPTWNMKAPGLLLLLPSNCHSTVACLSLWKFNQGTLNL